MRMPWDGLRTDAREAGASLRGRFEAADAGGIRTPETLEILAAIETEMGAGRLRVVEPVADADAVAAGAPAWRVVPWVKRALLLQSRLGQSRQQAGAVPGLEMDTAGWRTELVPECFQPAGSQVRRSAYLGPGCVLTPPATVQAGAFVGAQSVLDAQVLIGVCAQVGARVVVQGGTVIGGQVMPLEGLPNIVEDDCFLGGGCGLYDGVIVGRGSILLPGTVVRARPGVWDARAGRWLARAADGSLTIPAMAVVGMGSVALDAGRGVHLTVAVVLGTRRSLAAGSLEEQAIDYADDYKVATQT